MTEQLQGLAAFKRELNKATDRATRAIGAGAYAVGNAVVVGSVERCPIDTGNLRRSHYVTEPQITGQNVVVEFGAGGTAERYALEVHENLAARHPQGEAKYLEKSMNKESGDAAQNLIATARAAFEQNKGFERAKGLEENPYMPSHPNDHKVKPRVRRGK